MFKAILFAAFIPALAVLAQVTPSEPAPGNVYNEGSTRKIEWAADTTGQWTTLNIELMTGSNAAMVHLTTVATLDGTKDTAFSYTCPSVSPNSAIYFYQFSTPAAPTNLTWTGRFAIADTNGKTVDPTDEANGIKFGTGALADSGSASPAPSYLNGAVVSTTASGASGSGAGSSTGSGAASTTVQTVISASATGALTATGSLTTSVKSSATGSAAVNQASGSGSSSSSSSAASSSTSSTSGASALVLEFKARGLQVLAGLAGTAFVFATIF